MVPRDVQVNAGFPANNAAVDADSWIFPAAPCDSMRDAVFTVSPHKSYVNFFGTPAVCIAGDGDFLMSATALATAVQYELPIVVLVIANGMY